MSDLSCFKDHSTVLDVQYLRYVFLCRAWWNNTTVYIFLNPICRPIEKSIPTIKFPWKYIHTSLLWGDWNEQIWFQETGRETGLRSTDQAVNGYSSRPGTKLIHPKRPLEKGERGKRWGRKNMRCSLFLAAGMNYLARGKDRLTLAILFLVPLMTVVVNIHRQTPFPLLHNSLLSDWEKYLDFFNALFSPLPRDQWRIYFFFPQCCPLMSLCVFSKVRWEGGCS